jgi:hypothetical protein
VTGALCSRSASLADIGRRFGQGAAAFDSLLEDACSGGSPVASDSSTCTWRVGSAAYIWDITAHMHLLGETFKVTLNPGTANSRVLLDVPSYNFHYQRSYAMAAPVRVSPGDRLQVSCSFDPALRGELPYLRTLPPRYVLWGDGSSDEMCLAIVAVTNTLQASQPAAGVSAGPGTPQWPAALLQAGTTHAHAAGVLSQAEVALSQQLGDDSGFLSRFGLCGVSY